VNRAAYWEAVAASGYAVPRDRTLSDLTVDLVQLLGSPDPWLRNTLAYTVLTCWIGEGVYDDLLEGLGDGACAGLVSGLGDAGSDTVFRRSYSALVAAAVIERDNCAQLLHPEAVLRWGDRALAWFVREKDVRGYVGEKGWAHTVAHGGDLMRALGMSRHFGSAELGVLLDAIADRLERTNDYLVHQEEDRLASAVVAVFQRGILSVARAEIWLERLVRSRTIDPTESRAAVRINTIHFVRSVYLQVHFGVRGKPGDRLYFATETPQRRELAAALDSALRLFDPETYAEQLV
jgi:hypothetical protein